MNNTLHLLTREINQYDQDGEYFVALFQGKPSREQLHNAGVPVGYSDRVLNDGGGRTLELEEEWFYLLEIDPIVGNRND